MAKILLEDGSGFIVIEDGSGDVLLEEDEGGQDGNTSGGEYIFRVRRRRE